MKREERDGMRDGKLVRSRQRSLSSRFILPHRERPLLAGNTMTCKDDKLKHGAEGHK